MVHERTDKTVAASREGLDEPRFVSLLTESPPQLLDCRVQAVLKVHKSILGPQPLAQLFTGNKLAGMFEQYREDSKGLFLQFNLTATLEKLARAQVQSVYVESQERCTWCWLRHACLVLNIYHGTAQQICRPAAASMPNAVL